ncbi:very short patch repair endonuclease [Rhodobacterales bacterium 52_120_T64]|nr:very short patch repair endonuclease [Rhodobacterales bacterium 52_120_T64]
MADIVSPEKRSLMMSGIRGKNTKPEIQIRKMLHAAGFRFRLHRKDLPGKPDIVLPRYKVAIFVHGCFWHGHDNCHLFRLPKSRTEFWEAKISGNIARDKLKQEQLLSEGWRVLLVRECALKGKMALDTAVLSNDIKQFVCSPKQLFREISGKPRTPNI